jgi:hypothetical protein
MSESDWRRASDDLHARAQHWIQAVDLDEPSPEALAERDSLALDIARFQARRIEAIATLWNARGETPESVRPGQAIPALSCDVFRVRRVAAHPPDADVCRFRTTGTSQGAQARGEHPLRTTVTYEQNALRWAQHMLWPDGNALDFVGLAASEDQAPDSSLTFMLARFAETLDGEASWHIRDGALDIDAVVRRCREARRAHRAVLVAGTSLAFAELSDELDPASLALSPGSRVMHTGGFKGRTRELLAESLRDRIAALFDLPISHVVGEYGMTELSSQLYEGSLRKALGLGCQKAAPSCFYPPPWMTVRVLSRDSLEELRDGQAGLCEVLDLANVDSAVVILTGDLAAKRPDGSIELLGRAAEAPPRGCSLAI